MSEIANGEKPIGRERSFKKAYVIILVIIIVASAFVGILYIDNPSDDVSIIRTSFSEQTRANSTDNYTQLALDFAQETYPNKTIELISTIEFIGSKEIGTIYTIVLFHLTPGDNKPYDAIEVTVRHDTLNVEMGRDQIVRDNDEYWDNLPEYYKKLSVDGRRAIISVFGALPDISDPRLKEYRATPTVYFNPHNFSEVTDAINSTGDKYEEMILYYGIVTDALKVNMSLDNILQLTNNSFINKTSFFGLYKCEIEPKTDNVKSIVLISGAIAIPLIIRIAIKFNRKQITNKEGRRDHHPQRESKTK